MRGLEATSGFEPLNRGLVGSRLQTSLHEGICRCVSLRIGGCVARSVARFARFAGSRDRLEPDRLKPIVEIHRGRDLWRAVTGVPADMQQLVGLGKVCQRGMP